MKIIKTQLEEAEEVWPDELLGILWAYKMSMRTPTRENPFKLAYGSKAVIVVEVHMANHRIMKYQDEDNEEQLCLNLDLIYEVRMDAEQRTARYKNLMTRQYDAMLKPRCFNVGDLILKKGLFGNQKPNSWEIKTKLGWTLQGYQLQKTRVLLLGDPGQEEIGASLEC